MPRTTWFGGGRRAAARVAGAVLAAGASLAAVTPGAVAAFVPAPQRAAPPPQRPAAPPQRIAVGGDIAWPQCPKGVGRGYGLPLPTGPLRFVVLGVGEGSSGFTRNPCLPAQVAWARSRGLRAGAYLVPGFPKPAQLIRYHGAGPYPTGTFVGQLANVGYAQAISSVVTLRAAGLGATPLVWLDVENPPLQPWSRNPALNVAVLRGATAGLRAAGYRVGVYTYPYGWWQITGGWRPGLPMWATGAATPAEALRRCTTPAAVTGGQVQLSQWWVNRGGRGVLYDITCPAGGVTAPRPSPLFPYNATTVRYGGRGPAVAALQRALGVRPASGRFGPRTRTAVLAWQRRTGQPATGVVTPAGWAGLGAASPLPGRPALLGRLFTPLS